MPPADLLLYDLAVELLTVARGAFDVEPDRVFVSGGPDFALDIPCSMLIVSPVDLSTSRPNTASRETLQPINRGPQVRQVTYQVTLVSQCQPLAKVAGAKVQLPTVDQIEDASQEHMGYTYDVYRAVSGACTRRDGALWSSSCSNVVPGSVAWAGPSGGALVSRFPVTGDQA